MFLIEKKRYKEYSLFAQGSVIAPCSFLFCHICDKRGFPSLGAYTQHLASQMHRTLREMHVEKLKLGLQYLRADAKVNKKIVIGLLNNKNHDYKTTINWLETSRNMQGKWTR